MSWVLCPAGTKRGARGDRARSSSASRMCSARNPMGPKIPSRVLAGARRRSPASVGSSMLTLMRSARRPRRDTSSGEAPGMALAWMYPPKA
ncbi:MAG: hypothetical protein BWY88_01001 [Synergistetes bacterium ADurb.Bin520]|nr:MAG: hypothetical protein BWY88_01001 [Synergistetes bacterium ADurb.Bin520]